MVEDLRAAVRGLRIGREQRELAIQAVVIGVLVWFAVFALRETVHWLFHEVLYWVEHAPTPLVLFVPLSAGALLVGLIAQFRADVIRFRTDEGEVELLNAVEGDGIERAIALYFAADPSVRRGFGADRTGIEARWTKSTLAMAARKFVASLITLGVGGSGGLEASSALIGENLGAWYYKLRSNKAPTRLEDLRATIAAPWTAPNPDYLQAAQLSGIAAAVTVLLGAPLAAAFFAAEVMYRSRPLLDKLFYSLISAIVAHGMTSLVTAARPTMFGVTDTAIPPFGDLRYWSGVVLMGIAIAFVGQLYRILNVQFHLWFLQRIKNRFARLLVGFGLTGAIALVVYTITRRTGITDRGLELVLGSGEGMVLAAFAGQVTIRIALIALVAKMLATLATINSGGSAGLLIPTFFFGTMVAAAFAQIYRLEPVLFIGPALAGSLMAIVNTPFAAILFVMEEFGAEFLLPALVLLIITGLLSSPKSIYRAQRARADSVEVLPGYDIHILRVPFVWVGQTLADLKLRERFGVRVVGLLDRSAAGDEPQVEFDPERVLSTALEVEDTVIVYGHEKRLDAMEADAASDHAADESM